MLGIAIAPSTFDPNCATAELFPQGLQHTNFVVDAIDANFAGVIRFSQPFGPVIGEYPLHHQVFVSVVIPSGAVAITVE